MPSKRAKIIATLGPTSQTKQVITQLIQAGTDVFRLNFSHGTHAEHLARIRIINELNDELGTHICKLQDLQGPKIRIGNVQHGGVRIEPGQSLIISTKEEGEGTAQRVSTTYSSLAADVTEGELILIDDGKIQVRVISTDGIEIVTEVIYGGLLQSRKGINLPNTKVSLPSLTEKDKKDLAFGLAHDIEWVALSFVRSAQDIVALRQIIAQAGRQTKIIAKIEKPEAILEIDAIIEATDAVMVARGDLGVEMCMEDVPMIQKRIVNKCNALGKPVIIATQMLESMIESHRPTRAEVNDIANSILDGADTVMLSAESASGAFPVDSVACMAKCIQSVEETARVVFNKYWEDDPQQASKNNLLIRSACRLSASVQAKAIVGMTKSGFTAFSLAKNRPKAHIYIFTDNKYLLRTMSLVWGIQGFYYDGQKPIDETFEDIVQRLKVEGALKPGDVFVHTASMPLHWQEKTNMIKMDVVK